MTASGGPRAGLSASPALLRPGSAGSPDEPSGHTAFPRTAWAVSQEVWTSGRADVPPLPPLRNLTVTDRLLDPEDPTQPGLITNPGFLQPQTPHTTTVHGLALTPFHLLSEPRVAQT